MKRNLLKRIGAVALAVAVSLTMGTAAFAADMETDGTIESDANSVTLKKAIKITNYSGYAYEPTITYTYTLSDGTASGKVTDKDGNKQVYELGVMNVLRQKNNVYDEYILKDGKAQVYSKYIHFVITISKLKFLNKLRI